MKIVKFISVGPRIFWTKNKVSMQRGLVCAENAFCESICRDDLCLYGIIQKKYLMTCKKIMQIYFFWLYIF